MNTLLNLTAENINIQVGDKILIKGQMASGKTRLLEKIAHHLPENTFDFLSQTLDDNFISGTVAENLAFKLENAAMALPDMKKQVRCCAETYGLTAHLKTDVSALTTYQKQQLALVQLLIAPSDCLFLDEPLFLPSHYDGTLIVTGDFDTAYFDQVIDLSRDHKLTILAANELNLDRHINPDKAILSVTELVENVSFTIYQGEKVAISGLSHLPLADQLAGFLPTSGEIDYYYEDITHQALHKRGRKIGYVMANPDDMIFLSKISEAELSDDLLTLCQLDSLKKSSISQLSYRQKRWFTLACILKQATPIVLIDQPEFEGFPELLTYLDQQGTTLLVITDQPEFLPYLDRQEVF